MFLEFLWEDNIWFKHQCRPVIIDELRSGWNAGYDYRALCSSFWDIHFKESGVCAKFKSTQQLHIGDLFSISRKIRDVICPFTRRDVPTLLVFVEVQTTHTSVSQITFVDPIWKGFSSSYQKKPISEYAHYRFIFFRSTKLPDMVRWTPSFQSRDEKEQDWYTGRIHYKNFTRELLVPSLAWGFPWLELCRWYYFTRDYCLFQMGEWSFFY